MGGLHDGGRIGNGCGAVPQVFLEARGGAVGPSFGRGQLVFVLHRAICQALGVSHRE